MKLEHIKLEDLKQTDLNVRKHGGDNVDDLKSSIRSIGIIQPLLVRKNCQGYEVIAGNRRFKAALSLANDNHALRDIPCAILEDGDDAKALEASLAENIARLPMDELDQYEAFKALIDAGKTVEEIANDFGVTERLVRQRMAIANLHPPILKAYRREEIKGETMRILTLATKKQQREWYKLFRDPKAHAPQTWHLKAWLFGGAEIPVSNALFELKHYKSAIKGDLFGDERYFTDAAKFWELQNKAIAAKVEAYLKAGWSNVVVLDVGKQFYSYCDYTKRSKKDGGRVYVASAANGEVTFHEGWLETKQAKKLDKALAVANGTFEAPTKPELTKAAESYMHLHRHAAVRTELLSQPQLALRLMVAHVIASSSASWRISPQGHGSRSEAIEQSLANSKADKVFEKECETVCNLLGVKKADYLTWRDPFSGEASIDLDKLFAKLCELTDKEVMRALTFAMAETLEQATDLIDTLGQKMKVDMTKWWSPDDAFYDLLRDKQMVNAMLKEIGGKRVADGNVTETAKAQKKNIRDFAEGTGRKKVEGWLPRYMLFPYRNYLKR